MQLVDITDLLAEYRENKERQRVLKAEMVRAAVETVGLSQEEAHKNADRIEFLLDGYLIGHGMRQHWRTPA